MKDIDIEEALRKFFNSSFGVAPAQHRDRTPGCPSLARMREIALNPDGRTPGEAEHFATGCEFCRRMLAKMEQEVWHPNPAAVFSFQLGERHGERADLIKDHLDRDKCRRCLDVAAIAEKVRVVGTVLRQAAGDAERRLRGLAWGLSDAFFMPSDMRLSTDAAVRGSAEMLADTVRMSPTPRQEQRTILTRQSEDGSLLYSVVEDPQGFVRLNVWTESPELGGALVRFDLYDRELQGSGYSCYAILAGSSEKEKWEAAVKLLSTKEALRRLGGKGWHVIGLAVQPGDLTAEDEQTLRESIERIEKASPESLAWSGWLEAAMADPGISAELRTAFGRLRTLVQHGQRNTP